MLLLTVAMLLAGCGAAEPTGPPDLLLQGGTIWTGKPLQPWAEWLAIRGERVVSLGSGTPPTGAMQTLELEGRLVVPGFNDSHVHLARAGESLLRADPPVGALQRTPEGSGARRVAETRRALEEFRRWGVTSVQDISPLDQLEIYEQLRAAGELTVRVHFSPSGLDDTKAMLERGWIIGAGDEWIRFGTLTTHVDGIMADRSARFFEPYLDSPVEQESQRGGWREFSEDLQRFERLLLYADSAKVQLRVHAVGDEANSVLLDLLEELENKNGVRNRRFRIAHAQVLSPDDLPRLRGHGLITEVQPYQCLEDMRWMEARIGHERSRGACAFRSLQDAGAVLAFGSDWPGSGSSSAPANPLLGLYAAVTRRSTEGLPQDGWFPDERITLEDALRAYTRGSAYATFEEDDKGTLEPGKLADLVVLDTNLFETPPSEWLEASVDYTLLAGRIIFRK